MGRHCCCGNKNCVVCSSGKAAFEYQIEVSGMDCAALNGIYTVQRMSDTECLQYPTYSECCFRYEFAELVPCSLDGEDFLVKYLYMGLATVVGVGRGVYVAFYDSSMYSTISAFWQKNYAAPTIDETDEGDGSCQFDGLHVPEFYFPENDPCVVTAL